MRFKVIIFSLITSVLISCSSGFHAVKSNRALYPVNAAIAPDSTVIKAYLPYKLQLDAEMSAVVGFADFAIVKSSNLPESSLGNFFADACFAEAKKKDVSIDFAMPSTKGGLRADLPKGNITLSNVFELMPFENELLVIELKGTDVEALLDAIAASNGQPVAGIKMKIANKKAKDVLIGGVKFNRDLSYRVLTSDYIASGGDNFNAFKNGLNTKVLGLKVRDALLANIKEATSNGKNINAKVDGRITNN